jgi:hypothetical protein
VDDQAGLDGEGEDEDQRHENSSGFALGLSGHMQYRQL